MRINSVKVHRKCLYYLKTMTSIFVLMFVVGLLSACNNPSSSDQSKKMQELQSMSFNEQTLTQFSWQLIESTDVNSQRIDALFLDSEPDKPITLKFKDKTLHIGNLFCNINSIGIHFEGNRLYVEQPIVATMMGCPDDISLRESTMIQDILMNDPTLHLQSHKGQIQLIIETVKKDKLIFNGIRVSK